MSNAQKPPRPEPPTSEPLSPSSGQISAHRPSARTSAGTGPAAPPQDPTQALPAALADSGTPPPAKVDPYIGRTIDGNADNGEVGQTESLVNSPAQQLAVGVENGGLAVQFIWGINRLVTQSGVYGKPRTQAYIILDIKAEELLSNCESAI